MININNKEQVKNIDNKLTLINYLINKGVTIPYFCYHNGLSVAGNCRACLVELENSPKPVVSCGINAKSCLMNNKVYYDSVMLKKARENILEFLLLNHPVDCPICDQGGECDLQEQSLFFGFTKKRFYKYKRVVTDKDLGPIVKTVMTRCIHCTRCVRFASEVAGVEDLGVFSRGTGSEIGTYVDKIFLSELSGNVIDLCPVGFFNVSFTPKKKSITSRYFESEKIIQEHLLNDYPLFTLFYNQVVFLQIINVLLLKFSDPNYITFFYVNLFYCSVTFIRGCLNFYIMFFHNTTTTEVALQALKGCVYFVGSCTAFHTSQSVYFIPPNKLSNFYSVYSPFGRGYGAHSCSQLIAADILKGQIGNNFDPKSITDNNFIISPQKLAKKYVEVRQISLKELGEHAIPKYSELMKPKS